MIFPQHADKKNVDDICESNSYKLRRKGEKNIADTNIRTANGGF